MGHFWLGNTTSWASSQTERRRGILYSVAFLVAYCQASQCILAVVRKFTRRNSALLYYRLGLPQWRAIRPTVLGQLVTNLFVCQATAFSQAIPEVGCMIGNRTSLGQSVPVRYGPDEIVAANFLCGWQNSWWAIVFQERQLETTPTNDG